MIDWNRIYVSATNSCFGRECVWYSVQNKLPGWLVHQLFLSYWISDREVLHSLFFPPLVAMSSPNRIDAWDRLCKHFETCRIHDFCICVYQRGSLYHHIIVHVWSSFYHHENALPGALGGGKKIGSPFFFGKSWTRSREKPGNRVLVSKQHYRVRDVDRYVVRRHRESRLSWVFETSPAAGLLGWDSTWIIVWLCKHFDHRRSHFFGFSTFRSLKKLQIFCGVCVRAIWVVYMMTLYSCFFCTLIVRLLQWSENYLRIRITVNFFEWTTWLILRSLSVWF